MKLIQKFVRNDSGATAIEYGLIAGILAVIIIAAITAVGGGLTASFGNITTALTP
jgi:pilus assembly protein Flp/PilA